MNSVYTNINIVDRIALRVLGVDPEIADQTPEDKYILNTLAYQLVGTLLLLFVLQTSAFYMLSKSLYISIPIGFLTASLIVATDRILLTGDWYLEGQYWYIFHKDKHDPRLKRIVIERWIKMGFRFAFGVVISVSIVTIASPSIIDPEINTRLDEENQEKNSTEFEEIDGNKEYLESDYLKLKDEHQNLLDQISSTRDLIKQKKNLQIGNESITENERVILDQIKEIDEEIKRLRSEITQNQQLADNERLGVRRFGTESGLKGCGKRCESYLSYVKAYTTELESNEADRARLSNELTQRRALKTETIKNLNENINGEESALNALLSREQELSNRVDEAFNRQESYRNERYSQVGKTIGKSYDKGGLVRYFNAFYHVLDQEALPETKNIFFLVKIFAIFLETIVFTSKLFGSARNYSCALYESHMHKWS